MDKTKEVGFVDLEDYRLHPGDHLLEYRVALPGNSAEIYVPYVPAALCIYDPNAHILRKWLFDVHHEGLLSAHRPEDQTFHVPKRTGYWPTLGRDVNRWCCECLVCMKFRSTRRATGPLKSILEDEERALGLPWQDVIVDCIGPFTRSETGEQYLCVYICTKLKVPKLEAYKNNQAGYF